MCSAMVFELMCKSLDPNAKLLVDKHLNFDVRYEMMNDIVTHKKYVFHTQQIRPSVAQCRKGKCNKYLCQIPDEEFKSAKDFYNPHDDQLDIVIGKLVKISNKGEVTFYDQDGHASQLDLNWRRLRNMAKPIVDEQLSWIVFDGLWESKSIWVNLGTLLLDNNTVRFDSDSYHQMVKNDDELDMAQCKVAWDEKIKSEKLKHKLEDKKNNGKRRKPLFLPKLNIWAAGRLKDKEEEWNNKDDVRKT